MEAEVLISGIYFLIIYMHSVVALVFFLLCQVYIWEFRELNLDI